MRSGDPYVRRVLSPEQIKQRYELLEKLLANQKYLLPIDALKPSFQFSKPTREQLATFQDSWSLAQLPIFFGFHNKLDQVAPGLFIRTKPSFTYSADENVQALKDEVKEQSRRELGLVVSVVEHYEMFAERTIKPSNYADNNVGHYLLPYRDNTANVHPHALVVASHVIEEYLKQGLSVVIHCNIGKGRSVSVGLTHQVFFGGDSNVDSAYETLSKKRAQAKMGEGKKQTVRDALAAKDELQEKQSYKLDERNPVLPVFKKFLSSLELKNALAQTISLKKLGGYFVNLEANSSAANDLLAFTASILDANNDKWYGLFQTKHIDALNRFLTDCSKPESEIRHILINNLYHDLDTVMCISFGCTHEKLITYKKEYLRDYKENIQTEENASSKKPGSRY